MPDPVGDADRDRVADQLPSGAFTLRHGCRGLGPSSSEALHPLRLVDAGNDDAVTETRLRIPNGWGRGDADSRSALECRHGIPRPADAAQALGPVEAAAVGLEVPLAGLAGIVGEQDAARIDVARRDEDHSLTSLGN